MAETIRLNWIRDSKGYELRDITRLKRGRKRTKQYICSKSGFRREPQKKERYVLEGVSHGVAIDLANTISTPKGAIQFTNNWGLLRRNELGDWPDVTANYLVCGQTLDTFFLYQNVVKELLVDFKDRNFKKWEKTLSKHTFLNTSIAFDQHGMGNFSINIRIPPGSDTPHIYLNPECLFDYIIMEICQYGVKGSNLRHCPHCGIYFMVGPGTDYNAKRVYDKESCKKAASRARQKSAK